MDAPQQINVSYYVQILNKIIQGYRMRLEIMARRNKVIDNYIETFTKGDTIRGISDNAFNTELADSRLALANLKQLLRQDRRLIRFIRREEKEEETILGKAIDDLDYAIELLTNKAPLYGEQLEYGGKEWNAAVAQRESLGKRRREAKRRLRKDKVSLANFINFCESARKLLHHIEKNMNNIEHRIELEESFLNNPNLDTFAIFVSQWREEVKKELELRYSIIIFIKKHKVKYELLKFPVPISVKFAVDIAKRSWPGLFVSTPAGYWVGGEAGLIGLIATIVTATGVAFGDLLRLFDEIEKTAEISSEKLIRCISKIERKHWWDRAFRG